MNIVYNGIEILAGGSLFWGLKKIYGSTVGTITKIKDIVNIYGIFAKMFITSNLEGGTAMLRKLNCFLNIVIGSFIGVFIGFGIYNLRHTVS